MRRRALTAFLVVVVASVAAGIALAGRTALDDAEQPITGTALARASAAALSAIGDGRITETEVGDEDAYYEVEVTLPDGSQVDVHLDRSFAVVSSAADDDTSGDSDSASDS